MADLIQPKEVKIGDKTFLISKLPAIVGREIIMKYPVSNMPKIGDYVQSEAIMLKLMSFVDVVLDDRTIRLNSSVMVNNHVSDWEMLMQLEKEMISYNCSFFQNGAASTFFAQLMNQVQKGATEMLTTLSRPSSTPK